MISQHPKPVNVLRSRARVPEHVVHRQFAEETVILNLKSGYYHGLNPSGGRFLDVLDTAPTVGDAAATLAAEFDQPLERLETDIAEFCLALVEHELLVLVPTG